MAPSACNSSERYRDLWEFPLQQFLTGPVTNGRAVPLSTMVGAGAGLGLAQHHRAGPHRLGWLAHPAMLSLLRACACASPPQDPTADTEEALLTQLLEQFGFSYGGNRAPVGIAVHTPW